MHEIFNLEKLYSAYLACRRGKRKTIDALKFEWDLERNLFLLEKELLSKKYRPGRSLCFVVTEPVIREIIASGFRDRVVQHLLISEIELMGEKAFVFDSFSCRKGKGTHFGVGRLRKHLTRIGQGACCAQLDISGFFMSIDQNVLYSLVKKLIAKKKKSVRWKKEILWLARVIIFHNPTKNYVVKGDASLMARVPRRKSLFYSGRRKGLPIGNHSSQFFANLYLNELDQFVKRELKCRHYLRYVDDIAILENSEEKLRVRRDQINDFLKRRMRLVLNLKKTKIQPVEKGVDFLGYFLKPDYTLVRRRVVKNFRSKLYGMERRLILGDRPDAALSVVNSYFGHFLYADSFNLRRDFYYQLGELRRMFSPEADYSFLKARKLNQ